MIRPKTTKPSATKRQKKLIHWGAGKLNLDDDAYRGLLWGVTGKASTLDITPREAAAVLAEMERRMREKEISIPWKGGRRRKPNLAWKPSWLTVFPASVLVGGCPVDAASHKQREIIRDRWLVLGRRGYYEQGREQAALDGFLMRRFSVPSINHLTMTTAKGVVKTMIEMTER